MLLSQKILGAIVFSQMFILGVFGGEVSKYYVFEDETKMCGTFVRGTAQAPNWLPDSWTAVVKTPLLQKTFLQSKNCSSGNSALCCQEMGFSYTPNPIGSKTLSAERSAAEFLSRKKIIEPQSLTPKAYRLSESLSRKEFMKILINLSGKPLSTECLEVFADVANDWACKYIETALEQGYITGKQAFRPDDALTQAEALKLIFQAKDIQKRYTTDSWQQDYVSTAYYLGYIDEKLSDWDALATRGWIFSLSAKTFSDYLR